MLSQSGPPDLPHRVRPLLLTGTKTSPLTLITTLVDVSLALVQDRPISWPVAELGPIGIPELEEVGLVKLGGLPTLPARYLN